MDSRVNETVRPGGLSQRGRGEARSDLWRSRALLLGGGHSRMNPLLKTLVAVMAGLLSVQAADVLIAPFAVTAQSYYAGDNRSPVTAISGAGMTPNNPVTAASTAGNLPANAMWLSNNTRETWITFDLGSVETVTGFHLWNYNENGAMEICRGVRTAGIYTGTTLLADGSAYASAGAAWGTLVTNMTFAQASGTAADAGSDYTFPAPVTTRYLQLYVTDNFPGADAYTGISEIRFYSSTAAGDPYVITGSSSGGAYTVSGDDLLQTHLGSTDDALSLNNFSADGVGNWGTPALADGVYGPASSENTCQIAGGSVTYILDTTFYPAGFDIATINTYSGWHDNGRRDQRYTVTFRKVGFTTFGAPIIVDYAGTDTQTYVNIANVNLTGVDAVRFTFSAQQNGGVGYKEFDVIGAAPAPAYVVTGASSGSAYTVSGTDLLQAQLGSTADALALCDFSMYSIVNGGAAALTDGLFGPANTWEGTCQVAGGAVTYLLNTADHPAGYDISTVDTYSGWQDGGRRDQGYTVTFRKVGSGTFGGAVTVAYPGTDNQTSVNIASLGLAGVDAVRFEFPEQQNNGVGYKELDVTGSAPAYAEVTRLDSGTKVIASDAASNVRISEGSGTPGDITLGAAATVIRSLTQGATAGVATVNPAGQALALNGIYLQPDAGGLTIAAGTLTKADGPALCVENRSANVITVNAAITDGRDASCGLTKTGGGSVTLNNANTYSGVTVFGGGVVDVATLSGYGSSGSLGSRVVDRFGNVGLLFRGGTLRHAGAAAQRTDRAIRINADGGGGNAGGATLDASGSDPDATLSFTATASPDFFENPGTRFLNLTGSNTGNNTFAMAIGEAGGATRVIKSGGGTWVLTGANAYSGETRIEGGTLKGASPLFAPIAATAQSYFPDVAGFRSPVTAINGAGMTPNNPVAAYSTAGNVPANAMWLSNNTRETWITFDLGSVRTVTGFRLWNYNEYGTGTVEPYRGVRTAGIYIGTNLLADGSPYASAGPAWGTLVTNMTFAAASATPADAGGDYAFAAPVTTRYLQLYVTDNFPGADAYTGIAEIRFYDFPGAFLPGGTAVNLTASGAALILGYASQAVGSLAGVAGSSVVSDGTLTAGGDNSSQTFAGVISGSGSYVKQGGGTQTFSGANTYGGATTVSAGTLEITESDALPSGTALEIATGAGMLLSNAGEQAVSALTFDNVPQYRGTWGGPASGAQHRKAMFTGTGVLRVLTGPASPGMMILIF